MIWSKYQEAVFDFVENKTGHGCVQAVAGSGKSTTAVHAIERIGGLYQGLFTSFTNTIVNDLDKKLKDKGIKNASARTYNGFGASLVRKYMRPMPKLLNNYQNEKTDTILKYDIFKGDLTDRYWKSKSIICRLIALFKSLAILEVQDASDRYEQIIDFYDLELPKVQNLKQLTLDTFQAMMLRDDIMDYDDQKWFPILHGWVIPQVDFLIIDEYQDSCPIESILMLRACQGGRILAFGDAHQAIYSFKGTEPDSMAKFVNQKHATRLPLSICYRCSKAVVRAAQAIVPEIEYADSAIEGSVSNRTKSDFKKLCQPNDMVLARCTQDLVSSVIGFLEEGKAAYVVGREFGTQLHYFIEKVNTVGNTSIDYFQNALDMHFNSQYPALLKANKENLAIQLESRVETLKVLMVGCNRLDDLTTRINNLFTDKGNGIPHMTIHKSKGLEEKNVWILRPDKLPHPRAKLEHQVAEERRLKYVAITRAQENLNWVK